MRLQIAPSLVAAVEAAEAAATATTRSCRDPLATTNLPGVFPICLFGLPVSDSCGGAVVTHVLSVGQLSSSCGGVHVEAATLGHALFPHPVSLLRTVRTKEEWLAETATSELGGVATHDAFRQDVILRSVSHVARLVVDDSAALSKNGVAHLVAFRRTDGDDEEMVAAAPAGSREALPFTALIPVSNGGAGTIRLQFLFEPRPCCETKPAPAVAASRLVLLSQRAFFAFSPSDLAEALRNAVAGRAAWASLCGVPAAVGEEHWRGLWPAGVLLPLCAPVAPASLRRAVHRALLLPNRSLLNEAAETGPRPASLLRTLSAAAARAEAVLGSVSPRAIAAGVVRDVHTRIDPKNKPLPSIANATTAIVQGSYEYWHYRVDGFDDEGWGCAYRSLQTLLSWLRCGGHFASPQCDIPTLREIQAILARVDPEKQPRAAKFIGSKEWIGSFEVMMVVQHFVPNLECTVRRLATGRELVDDPSIKRLLVSHFQAGGGPVMIGGSAYAHTILGIECNLRTGDCQYLILDPHYSSNATDVRIVVGQKGWCGWKLAEKFFNMTQWYNVCIPRTTDDLS